MTIKATITATLQTTFDPQILHVTNQSHQHREGSGLESHFTVVLVSAAFSGQPPLARHRAVYQVLAPLLKPLGPVHALALHTYSKPEWDQRQGTLPPTPPCVRSV